MFAIPRVFNPFVSSVGSLWAFEFFCARQCQNSSITMYTFTAAECYIFVIHVRCRVF